MGDFAYPQDTIKVVSSYKFQNSDLWQNVYYYRHGGSTPILMSTVATDLVDHASGALGFIIPFMNEEVYVQPWTIYNVTQDEPFGPEPEPDHDYGGNENEALPPQAAALMSFPTGLKRAVGRKYLPGLCENDNEGGGLMSTTLLAALADCAASLLNGMVVDGQQFPIGHVIKATGVFAPWISAYIDPLFRTQRRRVKGVGA